MLAAQPGTTAERKSETHLALLVVDHDVVRLDVAVHDAARVAEVERLEELVDVVPHVVVGQARVQDLEVGVVDVLEHERGRFALRGVAARPGSARGTGRARGAIPGRSGRTCGSRTTSRSVMTLVPPARFWRILISRLIFFFLTGLSTLMTHLSSLTTLTPSKTSEYCERG